MSPFKINCCSFFNLCILCQAHCDSVSGICKDCTADLPWLGICCQRCALPLASNATGICGRCLKHNPAYDHVRALFSYHFPLDQLINLIKAHNKPAYIGHLARLAADHFADCPRPDYLIPVPMHPYSQHRRGFNQAQLLAREVGHLLDIPVLHDRLQKCRHTLQQHGLNRKQRLRNLRHAFTCRPLAADHVAVIDDVMTTGATLQQIATALKRQGVTRVDGWILTRTP